MGALWEAGLSQTAIAHAFHSEQATVSKALKRAGHVPVRRMGNPRGMNHLRGTWRGGRIAIHGYSAVRLEFGSPWLPMAHSSTYVLEHRLVMAKALGRLLTSKETVHHINGDRLDNRIENLQLMRGAQPPGWALRCADCGSQNIESVVLAPIRDQLALPLT
jgi:hypothetical protein